MRKIVFVFVGVALLVLSLRLMGGTYAFVESGERPERTHPIERLVREKIEALSTDTMKCEVSRLSEYCGGGLLTPHDVRAYSTAKRTKPEEVERDFFGLFSKALLLYNDIPEIRPYLEMYPVTAKDFLVFIDYGPRPRVSYALPYYYHVINASEALELSKMERPGRGHGEQPRSHRPISHLPEFIQLSALGILRKRERVLVPIIVDKTIRHYPLHNLNALKPVLQKMCMLHDMHISALQRCTIGNWNLREVGAGFWTQRAKMPLDEARAFVEQFIDDYLGRIRQKRVVEQSNKRNAKVLQDIRENLNWFCFRITFWDDYLNRVEEPYIAQVQCQDGMLYYCTADEGQRLQQIFEEPVPERFFPR